MGWTFICFFTYFSSLCFWAGAILTEYTIQHRLVQDLFKGYDPGILPAPGVDAKVYVDVSLHLLILRDLNTKDQDLQSSGFLRIRWHDRLLVWNPKDYDNIEDIVVSQTSVWLPNILVDNPVDEYVSLGNERTLVRVHADGYVIWEPDFLQTTSCPVDITNYPFDNQVCEIRVKAWSQHNKSVVLTSALKKVQMEFILPNGEWDIVDTEVQRFYMDFQLFQSTRSRSGVSFMLYLHRKRFFYVLNTIVPMVLLSCLNVLVFVLPSDCGEKMTLAVSALLAYTVYLGMISQNIPKVSEHSSILAIYLTILLGLSTASVICAGMVINVHFRSPDVPVPQFLFKFLASHMIQPRSDIFNNSCDDDLGQDLSLKDEQMELPIRTVSDKPISSKKKKIFAPRLKSIMSRKLIFNPQVLENAGIGMGQRHFSAAEAKECQSALESLYSRERRKRNKNKAMHDAEGDDTVFFSRVATEVDKLMKELRTKREDEFITWTHLAGAMDRLLVWVFLVLTASANIICLALLVPGPG